MGRRQAEEEQGALAVNSRAELAHSHDLSTEYVAAAHG
jgi:hypothetical protein